MAETEINNYINKKCYDCCHFKEENMELYKLNLPNGIANNIVDYSLGKENICRTCKKWRYYQDAIEYNLDIKRFNERNVEDDILIFLTVYEIPPYDYGKAFLKISKKKYEIIDYILWALIYHKMEGVDVNKIIKLFIESEKFNVKNTVRDINSIIKMMYEKGKIYQLNSYPEFKL